MKGIGRIIAEYRKKEKLNQTQLAELLAQSSNLRVTNKAVSSWEKSLTEPNATVFMHLCKILGIPDCVEEFFGSNPSDPMSVLNDKGKELAKQYIGILARVDEYAKDPGEIHTAEPGIAISSEDLAERSAKILTYDFARSASKHGKSNVIQLYEARTSAGTGEFMDTDNYSLIPMPADVKGDPDFAVTIHGDSMEPEFHDHQIVYVNSKAPVEDGDIGIFYFEGMTYIKKYQRDDEGAFLVSLNKKYDPIRVSREDFDSDSFRAFGKVCRF